jgi:adenine-specific DNA methylase
MVDTAEARKARGAFFTPTDLSDFVSGWAVRSASDKVLEPSCGEAAFLLAAGSRLRSLEPRRPAPGQLQGIEIHAASAKKAGDLLADSGLQAWIRTGNFFDAVFEEPFDAVVGNPPYVRYQSFSGEARARAQWIAQQQGVHLTGLASSWAAFVILASTLLKPEGRLGLVLPAELLTVNYAAPVRRFLMQRFARVRLVLFEARVFPGVLEEIVLLLAEGTGPTDHCELYQASDLSSLEGLEGRSWFPKSPEQKWIQGLLPAEAAELYTDVRSGEAFQELLDWGETDLGMVTGNNGYFTLEAAGAQDLGLRSRELLAISPPGSRHLRGLAFTQESWSAMAEEGARVYLFHPDAARPSAAARRYIAQGEQDGVHHAYKCRVRTPWWKVPLVRVPDLFLTYMNHDTPRLVANEAGARHLNSVHGVTLKREVRDLGMEALPLGMLNSLTLLGAELVGRSYGGGILKLEPKEADKLPLPSPDILRQIAPRLCSLGSKLNASFRHGDLMEVVDQVNQVLLIKHLGLSLEKVAVLREARQALFERRARRNGHR